MICLLCSTALFSLFLMQENPAATREQAGDFLTPAEKTQLEREENIENRIRVYESVSIRMCKSIRSLVEEKDFQRLPEQLKIWPDFLSMAFRDIDQKISRKKKSKNLIHLEIQLRKALFDLRDLKFHVPPEYQEQFDSELDRVETLRRKLVEILFLS
jgi:hypothetical protein